MSSSEETEQNTSGSGSQPLSDSLTLQKAIDLGEYDPEYLATFPEWHKLSKHMQWQMVDRALKNRRRQLVVKYAELCNETGFFIKPHLQKAAENIDKKIKSLQVEEEKLSLEFSESM
jgi:hypothetical protein